MDIKVTMSFLQIYRENIQDLLSHSIVSGGTGGISAEDNLPIREDPHRGFYVEGLQEYLVHSYQEAEALLNIGFHHSPPPPPPPPSPTHSSKSQKLTFFSCRS
jgi:hypothetical protein